MVIYSILREIASGIATNAAINAWCQAQYGSDVHVQIGIDQKRPPSPQDVPFVAISSSESTEKGLLAKGGLFFDVLWGVESDSKTVTGNLAEYDGARLCDELGSLIAASIERVEPGWTAASGTYAVDLSTPWFPLWCGALQMVVNIRR